MAIYTVHQKMSQGYTVLHKLHAWTKVEQTRLFSAVNSLLVVQQESPALW